MTYRFLPCIMVVPVFLAAWLMFTAPVSPTLAPDQIVAYEYPSDEEAGLVADELNPVEESAE